MHSMRSSYYDCISMSALALGLSTEVDATRSIGACRRWLNKCVDLSWTCGFVALCASMGIPAQWESSWWMWQGERCVTDGGYWLWEEVAQCNGRRPRFGADWKLLNLWCLLHSTCRSLGCWSRMNSGSEISTKAVIYGSPLWFPSKWSRQMERSMRESRDDCHHGKPVLLECWGSIPDNKPLLSLTCSIHCRRQWRGILMQTQSLSSCIFWAWGIALPPPCALLVSPEGGGPG